MKPENKHYATLKHRLFSLTLTKLPPHWINLDSLFLGTPGRSHCLETGEMAPWTKCLLSKWEDPSSTPGMHIKVLIAEGGAGNPCWRNWSPVNHLGLLVSQSSWISELQAQWETLSQQVMWKAIKEGIAEPLASTCLCVHVCAHPWICTHTHTQGLNEWAGGCLDRSVQLWFICCTPRGLILGTPLITVIPLCLRLIITMAAFAWRSCTCPQIL